MAKRNKQAAEQPKELTPKEIRLAARKKEQNRRLYLGVGSALGLAAVILVIGAIFAFLIVPNRTFASVGDEDISTQYFWKRMRLQKNSLQSQLVNLRQLEEQFGGGGYFAGRISELESTLSNPFSLAVNTLDQLLEEKVVARYASQNNITVSDEEVDVALREEVANGQGLVTEPQATETAVAGVTATADAAATATATALATPAPAEAGSITTTTVLTAGAELTGSETISASAAITESATVSDTAAITETATITAAVPVSEAVDAAPVDASSNVSETAAITEAVAISDAVASAEGAAITTTEASSVTEAVAASTEVTAAEVISAAAAISDVATLAANEAISPTATPEPIPTTAVITETNYTDSVTQLETNLNNIASLSLSDYREIVRSRLLRDKVQEAMGKDVSASEVQVKASHILLREIEPTATPVITDTSLITPTPLPTAVPPGEPTPTPTQGPRTITEALALAGDVSARLKAGEDFAVVAQEISEDGSASQGGDLGWFAEGAMVPEFENVAFNLKPGEVSEPFTTTFGAHIVKLMERDDNRPLEESKLEQNRQKAYSDWLQEQLAGEDITRPDDLTANLPSDLR